MEREERGSTRRATQTGLGESGKLEQRRLTCGRRILMAMQQEGSDGVEAAGRGSITQQTRGASPDGHSSTLPDGRWTTLHHDPHHTTAACAECRLRGWPLSFSVRAQSGRPGWHRRTGESGRGHIAEGPARASVWCYRLSIAGRLGLAAGPRESYQAGC
jgi:hypothetical protein